MIFKQLASLVIGDTSSVKARRAPRKKYSERDLLRRESLIGRQLFGPVPEGHQREFFCLDDRTWIWYERWIDPATKRSQEQTTRYELHTNGVIKIQAGYPYKLIEGEELKNLADAMEQYRDRIAREIYHRDPVTKQPLAS